MASLGWAGQVENKWTANKGTVNVHNQKISKIDEVIY